MEKRSEIAHAYQASSLHLETFVLVIAISVQTSISSPLFSFNFDATCDLQPCHQKKRKSLPSSLTQNGMARQTRRLQKRKSLPTSLLGLVTVKAILAGLGLRRQRLLGPPPPSLARVVARPHRPPPGPEHHGLTQTGMDGLTQNGMNGLLTQNGIDVLQNGMARQTSLQRKLRAKVARGLPNETARIEGRKIYTIHHTPPVGSRQSAAIHDGA